MGTFRLSVVGVLGDNSTDTDTDARWALGPEGADGWMGGIYTGSTSTKTSTRRRLLAAMLHLKLLSTT